MGGPLGTLLGPRATVAGSSEGEAHQGSAFLRRKDRRAGGKSSSDGAGHSQVLCCHLRHLRTVHALGPATARGRLCGLKTDHGPELSHGLVMQTSGLTGNYDK